LCTEAALSHVVLARILSGKHPFCLLVGKSACRATGRVFESPRSLYRLEERSLPDCRQSSLNSESSPKTPQITQLAKRARNALGGMITVVPPSQCTVSCSPPVMRRRVAYPQERRTFQVRSCYEDGGIASFRSAAHARSARKAGRSAIPTFVSWYSTLGGIWG